MLYEVIQGSWKWPHFLDSMPLVSLLYLTTEGASVCPEFSHFMDLSLPFWVRTATVHIPSVWAPLGILSLELIFCVTTKSKLVQYLDAVWGHSRVMKVAWHFLDSMTPCIFKIAWPLVSLLYLTTEGASVCPEFSHLGDLSLPFWVRIDFLCYKKVKIGKKVHPIASSLRASKILLLSQLPSATLIWCLKYHNLLLSIYISQHPVILKHLHVHILKSSSKTCFDISFMLLCSAWQPWFDQFKSLYQFPTNVSTVSLTLFLSKDCHKLRH